MTANTKYSHFSCVSLPTSHSFLSKNFLWPIRYSLAWCNSTKTRNKSNERKKRKKTVRNNNVCASRRNERRSKTSERTANLYWTTNLDFFFAEYFGYRKSNTMVGMVVSFGAIQTISPSLHLFNGKVKHVCGVASISIISFKYLIEFNWWPIYRGQHKIPHTSVTRHPKCDRTTNVQLKQWK